MAKREKSPLRKLIDERGVRDLEGVHAPVKELTGGLIQEIMDAELEDELGYSKYDYRTSRRTTAATDTSTRRSAAARARSN